MPENLIVTDPAPPVFNPTSASEAGVMPSQAEVQTPRETPTHAELERLIVSPSAPMLIERCGPAIVPRLSEIAKRAFQRQINVTLGILGFFFAGVFFAILVASIPAFTEWAGEFFLGYFVLYLAGITLWLPRYSRHRILRKAQEHIDAIEDVRCVGPLLDVLGERNEMTQKFAYHALTRLLPRCDADALTQLTPKQRDILAEQIGIVAAFPSTEWKIAVLNALSAIGKTEDLPRIYMMLRRAGSSQSASELHEAAQTCFDNLYARADWGNVSEVGDCLNRFSLMQRQEAQITTTGIYNLIFERLKLTYLLQQLQPADRHKLTPKQKRKIYAILKSSVTTSMAQNDILHDTPKLSRASLQAVRQMRDTEAIQVVRELASMEAATVGEKAVRAEAREVLRVLEAEAAREAVSGTLLRASSGPEVAGDELLRAAQSGASHTEATQLLCAGTGEGSERA